VSAPRGGVPPGGGLSARAGADPAAAARRRHRRRRLQGLLLVAPALIVLAALTAYPTLWVLWLSLQRRVPIFGIEQFEGLGNFIFLAGDPRFWNALRVTLGFTVASVGIELVGGLAVALMLHGQRVGRRAAISLLLLSWALPSVVTAKLFEWLFNPTAGLVNFALGGAALNWLGDPALALPGVIIADAWRSLPFVALLCYARLATIPPAVYEAAQIDGAGALATFWRITLPLSRQILLIAVLFRTLDALRAFDVMFILTGGGPAGTTETLTVYAYRSLFQTLQLGLGSAVGVAVFALVMAVAWGYLRALRREGLTT
jgi:multiple sugar transport system permease protein